MQFENQKFSVAAMMAYDLRNVNRAVKHSRHFATHATQSARAEAAVKPTPSYVAQADKHGAGNTGRIWRF